MVAQDCARAYRSNSILTAPPAQLVLMLYDAALNALTAAEQAFERPARDLKRFEAINRNLRKAQSIIAELRARIDYKAGGEFAQVLNRLYEYYGRRLLEANIRKQVEPVREVQRLLGELRDAWAQMLRNPNAGARAASAAPPLAARTP